MKKQFLLLVVGLVGLLVATGELARAAGGFGPGPRDPEDAQVFWEDAGDLAFERGQAGNVTRTFMVKPGHGARILRDGTPRGFRPTGGDLLVEQDGRTVVADPSTGVNPSWSPDGSLLAFERNVGGTWAIWTSRSGTGAAGAMTHGTENARFPQFDPALPARLAFISDRMHVPGGATRYRYALYVAEPLASGQWTKLLDDVHPTSPPRWSPDGSEIATTAGEECYRWGVYLVTPLGARARRITNPCRFTGTGGNDLLFGTAYLDYVRGLAGNDRILARDGRNRIEGNGGNDVISSGSGGDAVFGGSGNDRITAGSGADLVVGGPGRDTIAAGPGNDTIEARDGFRDVVDCGAGRDVAEVDRLDRVTRCERVLRP
jgi:hypothetical protein